MRWLLLLTFLPSILLASQDTAKPKASASTRVSLSEECRVAFNGFLAIRRRLHKTPGGFIGTPEDSFVVLKQARDYNHRIRQHCPTKLVEHLWPHRVEETRPAVKNTGGPRLKTIRTGYCVSLAIDTVRGQVVAPAYPCVEKAFDLNEWTGKPAGMSSECHEKKLFGLERAKALAAQVYDQDNVSWKGRKWSEEGKRKYIVDQERAFRAGFLAECGEASTPDVTGSYRP